MKIELDNLKKAVEFLEKNSKELYIHIDIYDDVLTINTFDRGDKEVTIEIFTAGTVLPKVRKTETL